MPTTPVPDLDDFRRALDDPAARARLGIRMSDADAALLREHDGWARTYFRQWLGERVEPEPGAPVALPRVVTLAPALPVPPPAATAASAPGTRGAVPTAAAPWWRQGRPVRAGIVAAAVGSILAAALVLVGLPQRAADADPAGAPADPFPAGLDAHATSAPTPSTASVPDASTRLADDAAAAMRLDSRTASLPVAGGAVDAVMRREVVRIADVACLSGYDDATAQKVAQAVSGQSDLDPAAGDAVADAISRYCAATAG